MRKKSRKIKIADLELCDKTVFGDIFVSQQSGPPWTVEDYWRQYYISAEELAKQFERSLQSQQECWPDRRRKSSVQSYSSSWSSTASSSYGRRSEEEMAERTRTSLLVDELLYSIYDRSTGSGASTDAARGSSSCRSVLGSDLSTASTSVWDRQQTDVLKMKEYQDLLSMVETLDGHVASMGSMLVKQLKRRDSLQARSEKLCHIVTAGLQALSPQKSEDSNMRFSLSPAPGDSGFNQWRDAMRMVARLPGGIPADFRKRLWITLAERHLQSKGVNWAKAERTCFNEWSNPDDSELGIQIVKDLHRTGCSLFCGDEGQENQALLKRVLLAYARWNKDVGYCQGFNMLAALILQVMDCSETDSVKVMIYLIEGVLPESYFANNLRGLSVDMAAFRDLLRLRLPRLSKHLEALQNDAREGTSYEPPLTNVFTMQWFLTLFCNCLPQPTVLRVWDLIFLDGNEILLRTALAIWGGIADRILAVNSADEFYSIMGVLTKEMLEFGFMDANALIKSVVTIDVLGELAELREKYTYNITPWSQSVQSAARRGIRIFYSDDDDNESDLDERMAVTAAYGLPFRNKRGSSSGSQTMHSYIYGHPDRERIALDISALKKQYAKLRERQRQAHIILTAACSRQSLGSTPRSTPIAVNHLLLGKNAITNAKGRRLGPPPGTVPPARRPKPKPSNSASLSGSKGGETLHWKDANKRKKSDGDKANDSSSYSEDEEEADEEKSSSSSTSTELCDEPGKSSDFEGEALPATQPEEEAAATICDTVEDSVDSGVGQLVDLLNGESAASANAKIGRRNSELASIIQENSLILSRILQTKALEVRQAEEDEGEKRDCEEVEEEEASASLWNGVSQLSLDIINHDNNYADDNSAQLNNGDKASPPPSSSSASSCDLAKQQQQQPPLASLSLLKGKSTPRPPFNPFPVQKAARKTEVGVKLGLYKDASPFKSPSK